jgi:hypothetical protein
VLAQLVSLPLGSISRTGGTRPSGLPLRRPKGGTSSVIMLTDWWLWKQRNTVIFDGVQPDLGGLLDTVRAEVKSWVAAEASGLAALLPPQPSIECRVVFGIFASLGL